MESPGFWEDVEASKQVSCELKNLKDVIARYETIKGSFEDMETMIIMAEEENDSELVGEIATELEDFKELSTLNYLAGLELQLNSWDGEVDLSRNGGGYLGIRYSYYMPHYKRKHALLEGNMHMITLSFGGFGRPMKREF